MIYKVAGVRNPLGNNAREQISSRLKNAEERIEKAVARIDAALARPRQGQYLEPRIAALECENTVLRKQNDEIAVRLGAAIGRLQQILKGP